MPIITDENAVLYLADHGMKKATIWNFVTSDSHANHDATISQRKVFASLFSALVEIRTTLAGRKFDLTVRERLNDDRLFRMSEITALLLAHTRIARS